MAIFLNPQRKSAYKDGMFALLNTMMSEKPEENRESMSGSEDSDENDIIHETPEKKGTPTPSFLRRSPRNHEKSPSLLRTMPYNRPPVRAISTPQGEVLGTPLAHSTGNDSTSSSRVQLGLSRKFTSPISSRASFGGPSTSHESRTIRDLSVSGLGTSRQSGIIHESVGGDSPSRTSVNVSVSRTSSSVMSPTGTNVTRTSSSVLSPTGTNVTRTSSSVLSPTGTNVSRTSTGSRSGLHDVLAELLVLVKGVKAEQTQIRNMLRKALRIRGGDNGPAIEEFPKATNEDELEALEEHLQTAGTGQEGLVLNEMMGATGETDREEVYAMLKAVAEHHAYTAFSLNGQKGKKRFVDTKIYKATKHVFQKSRQASKEKPDLKKFNRDVSDFLKAAPARKAAMEKRQRAALAAEDDGDETMG